MKPIEKDWKQLHYYELAANGKPLVMLHAQEIDARSYDNVWDKLSKKYHV